MKRKSISNKTRFEIFKRDSFTCQYCGSRSPDVVLHVDHIEPISKGGTNDILNLITACQECNSGKSNNQLSDNSVIEKQRTQLEALQERKEQLEMLMRWQKELLALNNITVQELTEFWYQLTEPIEYINPASLKSLVKKYGEQEVIESMKIAADQYLACEDEYTIETVWKAWNYVGRICNVRRQNQNKPYLKDILYIRGILRSRFNNCEDRAALELLDQAAGQGIDIAYLKDHARKVNSWHDWEHEIEVMLDSQKINMHCSLANNTRHI